MELKSPETLFVAWAVVPGLVLLLSLGLGRGLALVGGAPLGALTGPAGYLAGIALMAFCLEVGLSAPLTMALCLLAACAGPAFVAWRQRPRLLSWRPRRAHLPAAFAFTGAFALGMAPLVGSARSAVLGYVFNNDSVFHLALVELLLERGADPLSSASSFANVSSSFTQGYPLGAYAWPMLGSGITGVDAFHIWSPLVAVTAAMTALTCFHLLTRFGAPRWFAALAGPIIASGYLPYSYLAQGSAKEVLMPLVLLVTVALLAVALQNPLTWRSLLPAGAATAAGVADLGVPALAFLGPAVGLFLLVIAVRAWRARDARGLLPLLPYGLLGLLIAAPAGASSLDFLRDSREEFAQELEIGNLLGDLPLRQMLNVWTAGDYRFDRPDLDLFTWICATVALVLVVLGLVYALWRREFALPVAVAAAVIGSLAITPRVSIYFDAKTYVVIAPTLGLATAAGILLLSRGGLRERIEAWVVGIGLAGAVLLSAAYVYSEVWSTPRDRFNELIEIAERLPRERPLLMSEREEYGLYFFRDFEPWADWGERPVLRGFRTETNYPPDLPQAPDFDIYELEYLQRFRLLVERRRPGGSLPPSNFSPVLETPHYRVWRRDGPAPRAHLPLGLDRLSSAAPLDCESRPVRRFLAQAEAAGAQVDVSFPGGGPVTVLNPGQWAVSDPGQVLPPLGQIVARRGYAAAERAVRSGRYTAWVQGSFGPLLRLRAGGRTLSEVHSDLGLPDAWQPMGKLEVPGDAQVYELVLTGRGRHFAGDRHASLIGPLVIVPEEPQARVERMPPERVRSLCGQRLDWLEIAG